MAVSLNAYADALSSRAELETVTVFGTKTGETNLQQTPISITAFDEYDLDELGSANVKELTHFTPNLSVGQNINNAQIYIRGIGTNSVFTGSDPSVTVHYDGVYLGRFLNAFEDFVDVESIEVLRGPQGTLYGRNSTGGTINIKTRLPSEEFRTKVVTEYGRFNKKKLTANISGPLSEGSLFGSLAVLRNVSDGYVKNINPLGPSDIGDEDASGTEGKLRWLINDTSELIISADYLKTDSTGPPHKQTLRLDDGTFNPQNAVVSGRFEVNIPFKDPQTRQESYGTYVKFISDISPALKFTSITAFRHVEYKEFLDADFSEIDEVIADTIERQQQISQEFQLNWNSGDWKGVAGLFYFNEDNRFDGQFLFPPPTALPLDNRVHTEAYAVFSQATYAFTDALSGTVGLRYSYEEKELDGRLDFFDGVATVIPLFDEQQEDDWDAFTPKVALDYQLNDNTLLFGSISRGFKSGGFNLVLNQVVPGEDLSFDPEFVWSYEVGIKTDLLNKRLRLNATAFYYDYADLQLLSFELGQAAATVQNASDATIRGLELEITATPSSNWRFDAALAYLDATYNKFFDSPDGGVTNVNLTGNRLNSSPEYSANLTARYFQDLEYGTLTYRLNYYWQDEEFYTQFNTDFSGQKSYEIIDASINFTTLDEDWQVMIYGKNLTDEDYFNTTLNFSTVGVSGLVNPRRTYGVRAIYQF